MTAAAVTAINVKYDWNHPSWRDVVIDHIMTHPAERKMFLASCGLVGIELALSTSGGTKGERERPFLQIHTDWETVHGRIVGLVPMWRSGEHARLLRALDAQIRASASDSDARGFAEQIARDALQAIQRVWDDRGAPLGPRTLQTFYNLTVVVDPFMRGPDLEASWQAQMATLSGDHNEIRRGVTLRALEFLAVAVQNEPRFLRCKGWDAATDESVVAHVEEARDQAESARDILQRAEDGEAERDEVEFEHGATTQAHGRVVLLRAMGADLQEEQDEDLAEVLEERSTDLQTWLEDDAERAAEAYVDRAEDEDLPEEDPDPPPAALRLADVFSDL